MIHRYVANRNAPRRHRRNPMGKPCSLETKRKISERLTGLKRTPEQIERNRLARLGTTLSPEHKARISQGLRVSGRIYARQETIKRPRYRGTRKSGVHAYEHRRKAESALGRSLPSRAVVHHHTDAQLVICNDQGYHMELERRTRVVRTGGNPNTEALCVYCGPRPLDQFWRRKTQSGGAPVGALTNVCRSCRNKRRRLHRALAQRPDIYV